MASIGKGLLCCCIVENTVIDPVPVYLIANMKRRGEQGDPQKRRKKRCEESNSDEDNESLRATSQGKADSTRRWGIELVCQALAGFYPSNLF